MMGFGSLGEFAFAQITRVAPWYESYEDAEGWTQVTAQSESWVEVTRQAETWTEI